VRRTPRILSKGDDSRKIILIFKIIAIAIRIIHIVSRVEEEKKERTRRVIAVTTNLQHRPRQYCQNLKAMVYHIAKDKC
jgi:hypothetical protein